MKKEKRKFIERTSMFLILFLSLFLLVHITYTNIILPEKSHYKTGIQYQNSKSQGNEILFFGDSHPTMAINPEYIKNSINYANSGETYEQTYYKVRKVLEEGTSAKVFVFPLEIHSFSDYRMNPYDDVSYWLTLMSVDELQKVSNRSLIKIYTKKYVPYLGIGDELTRLLLKGKTEVINGWTKKEEVFAPKGNTTEMGLRKVKSRLTSYPELFNKRLLDSFLKILELTEKHNKKVILIKYPVSQTYVSGIEELEVDQTTYYATLNRTYAKYNNVIAFLDYQDFLKNNSLFSNMDHLNYMGAEVFSKQINEDIMLAIREP